MKDKRNKKPKTQPKAKYKPKKVKTTDFRPGSTIHGEWNVYRVDKRRSKRYCLYYSTVDGGTCKKLNVICTSVLDCMNYTDKRCSK